MSSPMYGQGVLFLNIFTIIMGAQNYPRCTNSIVKPVYGYVELIEDKPIISEYYDLSMPI